MSSSSSGGEATIGAPHSDPDVPFRSIPVQFVSQSSFGNAQDAKEQEDVAEDPSVLIGRKRTDIFSILGRKNHVQTKEMRDVAFYKGKLSGSSEIRPMVETNVDVRNLSSKGAAGTERSKGVFGMVRPQK